MLPDISYSQLSVTFLKTYSSNEWKLWLTRISDSYVNMCYKWTTIWTDTISVAFQTIHFSALLLYSS